MPKEQHHNHETEKRAVHELALKVIDCGWIFRNQSESDFGIDAELERCLPSPEGKKYVTGEIFKAQIKGTEKLELVDGEKMVVLDLSKDDLTYLCTELTVAPLVVAVDVLSHKAYWFDIKEQGLALLKLKPENDGYRIKTSLDNEITPENSERLYEFLRKAKYLTFREGLARHLTEKEIVTALLDVSSLHDLIAPPGHRVFTRAPSAYRTPGTVMSVLQGETVLDFVATDAFKAGDEIKLKMQLEFPKDEEGEKANNAWIQHTQDGGPPTIDLNKYVKKVKILAGNKTIAEMGSANVHLGPVRKRMNLVLRGKNNEAQLFVNGESWVEPGKLLFDSSAFDSTQAVHLSLSIEYPSSHAKINLQLNPFNISTCSDAAVAISLLESFKNGMELLLDEKGIQRKIAETDAAPPVLGLKDETFDLVKRLAIIEENTKLVFPFSKLEEINKEGIDNTVILSSLFSKEVATVPMTLSGTPTEPEGLAPAGLYVRVEFPEELSFSILGQIVKWSNGMIAEGKCESVTQIPDGERMRTQMFIPECQIRSMK